MREKFRNLPPKDKARLAANAKRWRLKNQEKFRANEKKRSLLRRHGITQEIFEDLLIIQNYKCAICELEYSTASNRRNLHVDHNHKTNIVRGLLCNGCNRGLGFFGDNAFKLLNAAKYIICVDYLEQRKINMDQTALATQEQVQPKGTGVDVCKLVQQDLELRIELGKSRYGERLTTFNGRDALLDAYQEVLDLAVYLRQEIEERRVNGQE